MAAWKLYPSEIPDGVDEGDCECHSFWLDNEIPVGKGNTPNEALKDLERILNTPSSPTNGEK